MKETPILFSTPMVVSILDSLKNMTRRTKGLKEINKHPEAWTFLGLSIDNVVYELNKKSKFLSGISACFFNQATNVTQHIKCRYGQPGDLLWVRETWIDTFIPNTTPAGGIYYLADYPNKGSLRWRPSIHMPKTAARIWLQVEEIRVERLHDISEEGAAREGCYTRRRFEVIWEKINGKDSWKRNPWVWVVKFKVLSTTGKPATG